jgi:site-specific recombinase XerD
VSALPKKTGRDVAREETLAIEASPAPSSSSISLRRSFASALAAHRVDLRIVEPAHLHGHAWRSSLRCVEVSTLFWSRS